MDTSGGVLFVVLKWPPGCKLAPEAYKATRRQLYDRMVRQWRDQPWHALARLEFHHDGRPHINLMVWGIEAGEIDLWMRAVWPDLSGAKTDKDRREAVWTAEADNPKATALYLSKVDKWGVPETEGDWGRRWWRWGDVEPFLSPVEQIEVPDHVAVRLLRYMRRLTGMRRRAGDRMSILVVPAEWERLVRMELESIPKAMSIEKEVA